MKHLIALVCFCLCITASAEETTPSPEEASGTYILKEVGSGFKKGQNYIIVTLGHENGKINVVFEDEDVFNQILLEHDVVTFVVTVSADKKEGKDMVKIQIRGKGRKGTEIYIRDVTLEPSALKSHLRFQEKRVKRSRVVYEEVMIT
jgi:hypothetical protein